MLVFAYTARAARKIGFLADPGGYGWDGWIDCRVRRIKPTPRIMAHMESDKSHAVVDVDSCPDCGCWVTDECWCKQEEERE